MPKIKKLKKIIILKKKMNPSQTIGNKRVCEVIDLTNDDEPHADKRVVISTEETSDSSDDNTESVSDEEEGNCCGICGGEYESRDDTADVCDECYETERNMCHVCKEVFTTVELLDEEGEYCGGICKECRPCVLDKLAPLVELLKK